MIRTRYKYIFTILGMISLLMSCSSPADDIITPDKPDVPDVPGVPEVVQIPIKFSSSELKTESATRAGLETKGVNSFYVWCFKTADKDGDNYTGLQTIMQQYKVQWAANTAGTTETNSYDWEYVGITDHGQTQNIKYWDYDATSYRYFGIAPCSTTGITYAPNIGNTEYEISFLADASNPLSAPYISKLWISNNDYEAFPNHPYGGAVVMEFMKPVTKVRIILVDEKGDEIRNPIEVGITSLSFAPTSGNSIVQKGTLQVSYPMQGVITFSQYYPRLNVVGSKDGSIVINNYSAKVDKDNPGYQKWYYVLPHIEQEAFQLTLKANNETKMATVPREMMRWNPNMEYTYKFKLTASNLQFIDIVQIGVKEWQTQDIQHDIYNW